MSEDGEEDAEKAKKDHTAFIVAEIRRDLPLLVAMLGFVVLNAFIDLQTSFFSANASSKFALLYDGAMIVALAGMLRFYLVNKKKSPLILGRELDDADIRRRLSNKRWNERLKLLANMLNAVGASSFLALTLVPIIQGHVAISLSTFSGLAFAVILHICGQSALTLTRTEE